MFWNTWNYIYQRFIFSYSKPFANFAAISEVLMRYDTERTYLTKGVIEIIFYIQTSQL